MKVLFLAVFILSNSFSLIAQSNKTIHLNFVPVYGTKPFNLNEWYGVLNTSDTLKIEELRFYISGIILSNGAEERWVEEPSFHLIDASDSKTMSIRLNLPEALNFKQLQFCIGIDSLTNVSGAMGGDLDPTKGMYWTWQNGYINFKLEGKCKKCKAPKNEFQFHLGGYQSPFNTIQQAVFYPVDMETITIQLNLEPFFLGFDLSVQHHIMSPGIDAVRFSKSLLSSFILMKQ